jgi:hypothetical protein
MKLTRTQNEMLNILSYDEYRDIQAFRFHSAGNTIKALRAKGLIETRYKDGISWPSTCDMEAIRIRA